MKVSTLAFTLFVTLLGGCALPHQSPPLDIDNTPLPPVSYQSGELNRETLYDLIVAELAGQRKQYTLSLDNYLNQARLTGSPAIAQRATHIAQYLQLTDKTLEAATLWQQADPENPEPYQIAASLLLREGDFSSALPLLQKALHHSDPQALQMIGAQADKLSPDELKAYIHLLKDNSTTDPRDPMLLTTLGTLYKQQDNLEQAFVHFNQALALDEDNHEALFQKAELLRMQGKYKQALQVLKRELSDAKPNQQLHTLYIQLLYQDQQPQKATQAAHQLLTLTPDQPQLGFYIALLMLENNQLKASQQILRQLLTRYPNNSAPHYYLGLIAQQQQQTDTAIEHFLQVQDDNTVLQSFTRISTLLDHASQRDRLQGILHNARNSLPHIQVPLYTLEAEWLNLHATKDDALNLLDEALEQHQDDITLLYTRAMLLDPQDIALMEQDLRRVIALQPDNSMALNALGYSLAIYTDRLDEALQLISQALTITPDDPAILDSMGWVLFKLGRLEDAINYLERAYTAFPDPEVTSHLVQAYHAAGQNRRAQTLLQENQFKHPDNEYLKDAAEALLQPSQAPAQ